MKILFILSTLIAINSSFAQEYIEGRTIRPGRAAYETPTDTSICATAANNAAFCSTSPGCAKGTSYFKCYNGVALAPKACADPTPYCSNGACVPDVPLRCESQVLCPGEGYFPVPDTCYQYTYCYFDPSIGDFYSVSKICNIGYPFTPAGPDSLKCMKGGECVSPSCTAGKASEWKGYVFPNFTPNQIALYCVGGKAARIDSCEGGLSIDLTVTNTKLCTVNCLKDYQVAVYELDNTKFYQCRGGVPYIEKCGFNQVFDGRSLSCVMATTQAPTAPPATTQTATTEVFTTQTATFPTEEQATEETVAPKI